VPPPSEHKTTTTSSGFILEQTDKPLQVYIIDINTHKHIGLCIVHANIIPGIKLVSSAMGILKLNNHTVVLLQNCSLWLHWFGLEVGDHRGRRNVFKTRDAGCIDVRGREAPPPCARLKTVLGIGAGGGRPLTHKGVLWSHPRIFFLIFGRQVVNFRAYWVTERATTMKKN